MAENKLAYKIRVARNASLGKMGRVLEEAHNRSGYSRAYCLADMLHCMKKFKAGYYDYLIFQMYDLNDAQRDTYLTRFRNKAMIMQMNDEEYSHIFDNKDEFNEVFSDYIGRQSISVPEVSDREILDFIERKGKVFAKMRDLACGKGAEIVKVDDFNSADSLLEYIKNKGFYTLEDVLENHPDLAKVYPYAANCMRMITLIGDDGDPHLIYCVQKFGNEERVIDNFGVHGPIDLETGEFLYPAHPGDTVADELYTRHPMTDYPLVGFKTPCFKEAKDMILKAAMEVPQMRYIGWDVAVTPTGPAIIEGNNYCAHDFWQLPGQTPDKRGIMPVLKELIPSFVY